MLTNRGTYLAKDVLTEIFCTIFIQIISKLTTRKVKNIMQGPLRTLLAGAAAWKFGGGLFSIIIIFLVVYFLLGKC